MRNVPPIFLTALNTLLGHPPAKIISQTALLTAFAALLRFE